jgi:hypothetical protein
VEKYFGNVARNIYLYAALPIAMAEIATKIIEMAIYGKDYFKGNINTTLDNIFTYIGFAVLIYYLILLYFGFREILKTRKTESLIFFILIPILLHISIAAYSHYMTYAGYKNLNAVIEEINSRNGADDMNSTVSPVPGTQ